jgi:hypothetical protein
MSPWVTRQQWSGVGAKIFRERFVARRDRETSGAKLSCCVLDPIQSVKEIIHNARERRGAPTPSKRSRSSLLARGVARSPCGSLKGNAKSREVQASKSDVFGVDFLSCSRLVTLRSLGDIRRSDVAARVSLLVTAYC